MALQGVITERTLMHHAPLPVVQIRAEKSLPYLQLATAGVQRTLVRAKPRATPQTSVPHSGSLSGFPITRWSSVTLPH